MIFILRLFRSVCISNHRVPWLATHNQPGRNIQRHGGDPQEKRLRWREICQANGYWLEV